MTDNLPASTAKKGIPLERLLDYLDRNLTVKEMSVLENCSVQNIYERLGNEDLENLNKFRDHKDKIFEHTQHRLVKSLTDEKIEKMSAYAAVGSIGLIQDKIQALRGQASEIIDHRHLVVDLHKAIEAMKQEQQIIDIPDEPA